MQGNQKNSIAQKGRAYWTEQRVLCFLRHILGCETSLEIESVDQR